MNDSIPGQFDILRCVIADDEPLALSLLGSLLQLQEGIEIAASCKDGREALQAIREAKPDLVFLDIEMPFLNGFDVVRRLQPEAMPAIVFTTAFNQYAIDAFDVHAVDYVLKPLDSERLDLAIQRAKIRLAGELHQKAGSKASIMSAIGQISESGIESVPRESLHAGAPTTDSEPSKILVRDAGKTHVIDPAGIDWVDAAGDYMCIHVGPDTVVARTTMKKLEEQLDERSFVRIHRSTLVNVSRVRELENLGKGDCILHLTDGVTLKMSRNYRERLMSHLV